MPDIVNIKWPAMEMKKADFKGILVPVFPEISEILIMKNQMVVLFTKTPRNTTQC